MARKRRWLRFSLGSILLLISAVAIWLGIWSNKARHQRLAADALVKAGYNLKFDFVSDATSNVAVVRPRNVAFPIAPRRTVDGNQLSEGEDKRRKLIRRYLGRHYADKLVGFSSYSDEPVEGAMPPTPEQWKRIQSIQSIREVHLREGTTDAELQSISGIPSIVSLTLASLELTEKGFASLQNLHNLRSLSIEKIAEGERVSGLRGLRSLRTLKLDDVIVLDNIDAKNLSNSPELRAIGQTMFRLNDEGLRDISQLVQLRELDVSFNKVTDEGMKFVSSMTKLERLEVAGTSITDVGLQHIVDLPKLCYLNLVSSEVTHEEVLRLRDRYPDRDIIHWPKQESATSAID